MPPVTLAVVGVGNRGSEHGGWALAHPDRARLVAVAFAELGTGTSETLQAHTSGDATAGGGHGGGDWGLMDAFVRAVATGNRSHILSGPRESLAAHLAVFAAERARRTGVVATVSPVSARAGS